MYFRRLLLLFYIIYFKGSAEAVTCYSCTSTPTKSKGGTCQTLVGDDTATAACTGQCQTKIEDKSALGMGTWYKRSCIDVCTAETGTKGKSSYSIACCTTDLCNGPRPTTTTTTTTTTAAPTGTTTAGGTGTTTTTTATTTTATTTTSTSATAERCYQCSTFFLGDYCEDDTVKTDPNVEKVVCDPATTGTCAKIHTSIGYHWLDYDWSNTRGCTTKCSGKDEVIKESALTDIHCCTGDLCNNAIANIPTRLALFAATAAMLLAYFFC